MPRRTARTPRHRDRKASEPTFRFDRILLGQRITRRSGTRSWRQFEQDNAILSQLEANGQKETLRLFAAGDLDMPALRAAAARGTLASGSLIADMALRERLWGDAGAIARILPRMGTAAATRKRYAVTFDALERKAAPMLGPEATVADLEHVDWPALQAAWGRSGSDWNHVRRAVSRLLSVLLDDKYHPFRRVVVGKIGVASEVERVPDVTVGQFWDIVRHAPEFVRPAFVVLVATGMRWGEYARTKRSHLRPSVCGVKIPGTKTKTSAATVYVDTSLWPWIEAGVPAPLGYKWTRTHWKRACAKAGITDLRLHDLRHLHGQLAIESVDVTKVADGLRHTQLATTRRYVRQKNRKDVAAAVGQALGAPKARAV